MVKRHLLLAVLSALSLNACVLGPDYHRPAVETADAWQSVGGTAYRAAGERWWELYGDPTLNELVHEGLKNNQDIQLAIERVNEAEAQAGYTRSDNAPNINGVANANRTQHSEVGATPMPSGTPRVQNNYDLRLQASYEIDFFGKYRRANEAARAELLAAEAAQRTVKLALTNQIVRQYFALLAADSQETVLRRTLAARQETLELDSQRFSAGITSEFYLLQTQAEVSAAQAQLAQAIQMRVQTETGLLFLLGRSPREVMHANVARGAPTKPTVVWVPEGLPSDILLHRPDLNEAEQKLIAANARIGSVRAAVFPAISLTSYLGTESAQVSDLFSGPAGIFQFGVDLAQPIFQAGRTQYAARVTEARYQQALANYKKVVASAFYDVRTALATQEGARLTLQAHTERVNALTQAHQQATARLEGGVANRLEVLDTERQLLQAQLSQIDAERAQRAAVADLFKALGGGWEVSSAKPTT